MNTGCGCTVANVAIAIGIDHPTVGDLGMQLFPPDSFFGVLLVDGPPSAANLVAGNKITFDDSVVGALDPQTLGANVDINDNIPTGTYYALGDGTGGYPNAAGLVKFNSITAAGDWKFVVFDLTSDGNDGTIESVELTITCAE